MKRAYNILFIVALFSVYVLTGANKERVNFKADIMRPVTIMGDSTALNLIGNVVFYHNGAIITCDSAVRYSEKRMDCFKNVVINQEDMYAYGDRAEYNGENNVAQLFAPIIKLKDKGATIYTFELSYNTKRSIAKLSGRLTANQDSTLLESQVGYYYSKDRTLVCVNDVQLKDTTYNMKTDSLSYLFNDEVGLFFRRAVIWNDKDDILSADNGARYNKEERYDFFSNSYILSQNQEVWSDSINYNVVSQEAKLKGNIQILDIEQQTLAFGDYGEYWGNTQGVLLTKNPSIVSYDAQQDTLYMRADTMIMVSELRSVAMQKDSVAKANLKPEPVDEEILENQIVETPPSVDSVDSGDVEMPVPTDSIESVTVEVPEQMKRLNDSIPYKAPRRAAIPDSLVVEHYDSMKVDSVAQVNQPTEQQDSMVRILYGFHDVKIFRSDFQAVCDSMVAFTLDSTAHLHIDPVMWNGDNQITAQVVDLYTQNRELVKAVFTGEPIMSSLVDTIRFNQVKGKVMESFFENREIRRTDVNGNGQTYYYMQDEKSGDIQGFLVAECANITFMISDKKVDEIVYKGNPVYTIYPIDKVPDSQPSIMAGFKWESERKPKLEEVFNRTIRPSESQTYRMMPKPSFPITESIMDTRARFIKDGRWQDRNDEISPEVREYIRSLHL